MSYNYHNAIVEDIIDYLMENDMEIDELDEDDLYDDVFAIDSITGNGGDFYDSEDNCAEYVSGNLKLALEAAREFDVNIKNIPEDKPARYIDSLIRCYLLGGCVHDAVKDFKRDHMEWLIECVDDYLEDDHARDLFKIIAEAARKGAMQDE